MPALWSPAGRTPFGGQHFPIDAESEELFPLKIRKVLEFPYIEGQTLRILAGPQLPPPPSLHSCLKIPNKPMSQEAISKVSPTNKIPGLHPWGVSTGAVTSPSKIGANLTNFLRRHQAQLPGSYHKTVALSAQGSSGTKQQLQQSKGSHLPRQWLQLLPPPPPAPPQLPHIHIPSKLKTAGLQLPDQAPVRSLQPRMDRLSFSHIEILKTSLMWDTCKLQFPWPRDASLLPTSIISFQQHVPSQDSWIQEKLDPKVTPQSWGTYETTTPKTKHSGLTWRSIYERWPEHLNSQTHKACWEDPF